MGFKNKNIKFETKSGENQLYQRQPCQGLEWSARGLHTCMLIIMKGNESLYNYM